LKAFTLKIRKMKAVTGRGECINKEKEAFVTAGVK